MIILRCRVSNKVPTCLLSTLRGSLDSRHIMDDNTDNSLFTTLLRVQAWNEIARTTFIHKTHEHFPKPNHHPPKSATLGCVTEWKILISNSLWTKYRGCSWFWDVAIILNVIKTQYLKKKLCSHCYVFVYSEYLRVVK